MNLKVCLNYEKRCHFVVECPDLQTDKPKKESNKKETFKKKVKKSLMTTCKCLDAKSIEEEEANISLMANTSSKFDSEVEDIDGYFFNLLVKR